MRIGIGCAGDILHHSMPQKMLSLQSWIGHPSGLEGLGLKKLAINKASACYYPGLYLKKPASFYAMLDRAQEGVGYIKKE